MTVAELIKQLSLFDPKMEVWTEGCDCVGDIGSLVIEEGHVLLKRPVEVDEDGDTIDVGYNGTRN